MLYYSSVPQEVRVYFIQMISPWLVNLTDLYVITPDKVFLKKRGTVVIFMT